MSDPDPKSSPKLRWLWIPIASLCVAALATFAVESSIASRWERARAEAVARLAADRALVVVRPNLLDGAVPGESWRDWLDVVVKLDEKALEPFQAILEGESKATDVAALDSLIAAHRSELEQVVAGARRTIGRCPSDSAFQTEACDHVLAWLGLGRLAVTAAERRFADGDADGALELLLASLQFGRDLGDSSPCIAAAVGGVLIARAGKALGDWLADPRLLEPHRHRLGTALAKLDSSWPRSVDVLHAETSWMADRVGLITDRPPDCAGLGIHRLALWRDAFSVRAAIASWWDFANEMAEMTAASDAVEWTTARSRYAAATADAGGLFVRMLTAPSHHADLASREGLARVRLLREVLAFASKAVSPELVDPFSMRPLLRRESEGRLVVWSLGDDGQDSGGTGWLVDPPEGKDIAIAVSR